MVRAVLTDGLTGLGFDLAWFRSLTSNCLCIFGLYGAVYKYILVTVRPLPFSELSLFGLALDLVD